MQLAVLASLLVHERAVLAEVGVELGNALGEEDLAATCRTSSGGASRPRMARNSGRIIGGWK